MENSYYDILNIKKDASSSDVKKAYHKLAKIHHPDKGGDASVFKNITEAFEVLKDENKRNLYNMGGKSALEQNGFNPNDMFSNMFGMGMGMGMNRNTIKKGKPTVHNYNILLEELYMGIKKKIKIKRKVIEKSKVLKCDDCKGTGTVTKVVRMGPMIQQMQSPCAKCNQKGFIFRFNIESEIVYLEVPKGSTDQTIIVLHEKGDDIPEGESGDLHIKLCEQEHSIFKRKGSNLFINHTITLTEALTGFELDLIHLDKRKLLIKYDKIISPKFFDHNSNNIKWNKIPNTNCILESPIKAKISNINEIKDLIINGQLKDKSISAFIVKNDITYFYQENVNKILENLKEGDKDLYYLQENKQVQYCVEGEGMSLKSNPTENGNLYLNLDIIFPKKIKNNSYEYLVKLGLGEKQSNIFNEKSKDIELHYIKECEVSEKDYSISDEEDEPTDNFRESNVQQCAQQ